MNLLAPERQPSESQADYRARRALSHIAVAERLAPTNPPRFIQRTERNVPSRRDMHRLASKKFAQPAKPLVIRKRKQHQHTKDANGLAFTLIGSKLTMSMLVSAAEVKHFGRRVWGEGRVPHDLNPNRERDAGKREKPKSAVSKRMDRPHRSEMMSKGHDKLMRFFAGWKP